ncbi:MAG: hypothetical protein LBC80_09925 [Treponema sp.]|jgi:hypothetical protein|nr:hypothetical protein [Treponema sp.]
MNDNNKANAWGLNETLLQSYRNSSYIVQSILLAVGALISEKNVFAVIATLSIIQLLFFARVISVRRIIVDFYKFSLYDKYDKNGSFEEEIYLKDKKLRKKINKQENISNSRKIFSSTRGILDLVVPLIFLIIWGALSFLVFGANIFSLISLFVLLVSAICLLIIHIFS